MPIGWRRLVGGVIAATALLASAAADAQRWAPSRGGFGPPGGAYRGHFEGDERARGWRDARLDGPDRGGRAADRPRRCARDPGDDLLGAIAGGLLGSGPGGRAPVVSARGRGC